MSCFKVKSRFIVQVLGLKAIQKVLSYMFELRFMFWG
jgi:hypothetical protein